MKHFAVASYVHPVILLVTDNAIINISNYVHCWQGKAQPSIELVSGLLLQWIHHVL